jgi:hypothetical protein
VTGEVGICQLTGPVAECSRLVSWTGREGRRSRGQGAFGGSRAGGQMKIHRERRLARPSAQLRIVMVLLQIV